MRKAKIYRNAHQWLGTANNTWKRFIGAREDSVFFEGYECYCNDQLLPNLVSDPNLCQNPNGYGLCYTIPRWGQITIDKPSDGVVTVASQKACPGAIIAPSMDTSNHFQMRTSEQTKDALNLLFSGRLDPQFRLFQK